MKAINIIKNVFRITVLTAVISMLPMLVSEVLAAELPSGMSITKEGGIPATKDVDYEVSDDTHSKNIQLLAPNLVISGVVDLTSSPLPCQIYFSGNIPASPDMLTCTIKDLELSQNGAPIFYFNKNVTMKVEGECELSDYASEKSVIIASSCDLHIVPNSESAELSIFSRVGSGIEMSDTAFDECNDLVLGDDSNNKLSLSIGSNKASLKGYRDALVVNTNVKLNSSSKVDFPNGAIEYFANCTFNGAVEAYNEKGPALMLPEDSSFTTSLDNKLFFNTASMNDFGAILNKSSGAFSSYSEQMFGSAYNTTEESAFTQLACFDTSGKSILSDGSYYAHSVLFRSVEKADVNFHDAAGNVYKTDEVTVGGNAVKPEDPADTTYGGIFKKWVWFKNDGFGVWDSLEDFDFDNTTIEEDTDIYSAYEYTVKFDSQGGSDVADKNVISYEKIDEPESPSRVDYQFVGWYYYDDDNLVDFSEEREAYKHSVNGVITLYAVWSDATSYVVTFNTMGGSKIDRQKVSYGERATKPADPTKEGYKFAEWYKDKNYNTKFDFDEDVILDNTILYAKWDGSGKHKSDKEEKKSTEVEYIDRDTFKSEYPDGTVLADANQLYDMKVHSSDAQTVTNQELLATLLLGADAKAVITRDVYMRSDLPTYEDGELRVLKWKNLPINTAGTVRAVVYNTVDGAYVIDGVVDATGAAAFTGFKLRPASTITICK